MTIYPTPTKAAALIIISQFLQTLLPLNMRKGLTRFGVLFALLCFPLTNVKAQNTFDENPLTWIRSDDQSLKLKTDELEFIGNYPTLELSDPMIQDAFETIASRKSGTIFLVGRFIADEVLMEFGKVSISNSKAIAGQHDLSFDSILGKASIIKLSYTISPKYKKEDFDFYINEKVKLVEILFFDQVLSSGACREVETYLALKYSVNITSNTEQDLRHYINADETKVWDISIDALYNDEVLGLGRFDALSFLQTQTYSSDAESIKLSFTEIDNLGTMPKVDIKDQSYLILSKKRNQTIKNPCGSSLTFQPWKVRFREWESSNPPEAFLWFDTILELTSPPILTNGITNTLLEIKQVDGGTQITLPLKGLDFTQDYYIVWELKDVGCEPWATATLLPCDEKLNQSNAIQLEVNEKGLSADILLLNQTTSERYEFSMSKVQGIISDLPEGQYELFVTHGEMVLIDKLLQCTSCNLLNSGLSPQFNQNNSVNQTIAVNQEQGIRAYPNPVKEQNEVTFHFWGFEEREFAIQISDIKGSVIHNQTFQYSPSSSEITYEFPTRGTYNVTFSSNTYVEVKRIIVQ